MGIVVEIGVVRVNVVVFVFFFQAEDGIRDLVRSRGLGDVYKRQIKYRQRLGGFVNAEQLLEVYGMDTNRLSKIKPFVRIDTAYIRRIDLNHASFKDILRHPYMEYYLAKAIVNYRDKNNGFRNVNELRQINLIYDDLYYRIRPYFEINPEYIPVQ